MTLQPSPLLLGGKELTVYDAPAPTHLLLQPCDEHDLEAIPQEMETISQSVPEPFSLYALHVEDWFSELSPWAAPPVFGKQAFGDGAAATLTAITHNILPELNRQYPGLPIILGGYSLAGLFALWAGYTCSAFDAIAAASPSVWFPGWLPFASAHTMQARAVYLSLGDKEPQTRNAQMSTVGDALTAQAELLRAESKEYTMVWNQGGHFRDSGPRTGKAFAWCMQHC